MTTMVSPVRRARRVAGDATAVICGAAHYSYAETWERCGRLVRALRSLGIRDGERVAVVGPNCHRYLELYQAVPGAGMVIVPLNQRHTTAELRYALEDSGARVLFSARDPAEFAGVVEHVIGFGAGYDEFLAGAGAANGATADFPGDLPETTLAGLFYTGGTTGAAKGVMLTHRNLVSNALHFQAFCPFTEDTRWLIAAPLFHAAGSIAVLATVWNAGQHIVLPVFDAAAALDLIEAHHITATLVVPTMLAAMSDEQAARPRNVSTLRYICHGGSPSATETLRRAHMMFPFAQLVHIYGATETAPIATVLTHEELVLETALARSCGRAAVGVDVQIVGADGRPAPVGVVGELLIRGPNVMVGYWNKPIETAAALVGGWYRSGDLGYEDERGYLFLVDRAKDMIVTGGENVYCTEVEDVLYRHPAVLEAAVFGIPDPHWGEAVHAVIVKRAEVTADELFAHCRAAIAAYKVPKAIEFRRDPLPKSGAGKVLKRELREPFWEGVSSRVAGG